MLKCCLPLYGTVSEFSSIQHLMKLLMQNNDKNSESLCVAVARVSLFQRTANYVIPRYDRRYFAFEKWCFRHLPLYGKLYRLHLFLRYDWVAYPIVKTSVDNIQRRYAMWQYRRLLKKSIKDPALRENLKPDYPIGCKRILISDNFYTSLTRDNVALITEGIECITPSGVRTVDGVEHEADVLVYATGFDTQGHHTDQRVIGPNGKSLSEAWADAPIAYEGCMVAGFPNYHFVTGPNTGIGSTSVIFMIEQAANMIIGAPLSWFVRLNFIVRRPPARLKPSPCRRKSRPSTSGPPPVPQPHHRVRHVPGSRQRRSRVWMRVRNK